jgi:hypothetical protein
MKPSQVSESTIVVSNPPIDQVRSPECTLRGVLWGKRLGTCTSGLLVGSQELLGEYQNAVVLECRFDCVPRLIVRAFEVNRGDGCAEKGYDNFAKLKGDLTPNGRVAPIDNRADLSFPLSWWTSGHTSKIESVEGEMTQAGYTRVANFDFLYSHIFLVYEPSTKK